MRSTQLGEKQESRVLGVGSHPCLSRQFGVGLCSRAAACGVVDSCGQLNIAGNTKLYLSSLATLRSVFPTVDVYPDWNDANGAQSIAVAVPAARPSANALMQRAVALQEQHHFRYPLPDLVGQRVTDQSENGSEVLTDDFAPVNLYEILSRNIAVALARD